MITNSPPTFADDIEPVAKEPCTRKDLKTIKKYSKHANEEYKRNHEKLEAKNFAKAPMHTAMGTAKIRIDEAQVKPIYDRCSIEMPKQY